jgi:hypothetical protein
MQSQMKLYQRPVIPFALQCEIEGQYTRSDFLKLIERSRATDVEQLLSELYKWTLATLICISAPFCILSSGGSGGLVTVILAVAVIACIIGNLIMIYPTIWFNVALNDIRETSDIL